MIDKRKAKELQEATLPVFYAEYKGTGDWTGLTAKTWYPVRYYDVTGEQLHILNDQGEADIIDADNFNFHAELPPEKQLEIKWKQFVKINKLFCPFDVLQEFIGENQSGFSALLSITVPKKSSDNMSLKKMPAFEIE